jgi:hypothetical protein
MMSGHVDAILDASILYGACRWHAGVYENSSRRWPGMYAASDDKRAFLEFLHMLLLYDKLYVEPNGTFTTADVLTFVNEINASDAESPLVPGLTIGSYDSTEVAEIICRQLLDLLETREVDPGQLRDWAVPYLYTGNKHIYYEHFKEVSTRYNLPEGIIPFALFAYRGFWYIGAANFYTEQQQASEQGQAPLVYVASSGRLQALAVLLNQETMRRYEFQKTGYGSVLDRLHLPPSGFSFRNVVFRGANRSKPYDDSQLTLLVGSEEPQVALDYVLGRRRSSDAQDIRGRWAHALLDVGSDRLCAVGAPYSRTTDLRGESWNWQQTIASRVHA